LIAVERRGLDEGETALLRRLTAATGNHLEHAGAEWRPWALYDAPRTG
jgi:hypothetical protein